jgi:hypothetical protein
MLSTKLGKGMSLPKIKMNMTKWKSTYGVQELQHDLGVPSSSFDNIGMSATSFLWEIIQEDNNIQEKELPDEEYQTDLYEHERFTDIYTEEFSIINLNYH